MKESKFFKNMASEQQEHHGTDAPGMPSKDDHAHGSTPHEDKKRSHHKEKNFPKERGENKMKIKTAPALIALLAVIFVFGLPATSQAKTTKSKSVDEKAVTFEVFASQPSTSEATKSEAFKFEAFTVKASDFNVSKFKADDLVKAEFNAVAFKNFKLKDFDLKANDSKVFNFKAGGFEKANTTFGDFEKAEFKA